MQLHNILGWLGLASTGEAQMDDLAIASAIPPAAVNAIYLFGVPLETWVIILNLVYITLALGIKVIHTIRRIRDGRTKRKSQGTA